MSQSAVERFHEMVARIRKPITLRECIAVCLRHIYTGDPLSSDGGGLPQPPAELKAQVEAKDLQVGNIRCVVYSRAGQQIAAPVLFYMHGGGFVHGCSEDVDYPARQLCHSTGMVVVSINYRLAPETMFPGALEDCLKVLDWAVAHADDLKIDPARLYAAGDSAGGNLAAAFALKLSGTPAALKRLVLFAPWLDMHVENYASYNRLAPAGIVFDAAFIGYCRGAYALYEQWQNPFVSPMFASPLQFPPTLLIVGTADPLLDQALAFEKQAKECGAAQTELVVYEDMPHCFQVLPGIFAEEQDCFLRVKDFLCCDGVA